MAGNIVLRGYILFKDDLPKEKAERLLAKAKETRAADYLKFRIVENVTFSRLSSPPTYRLIGEPIELDKEFVRCPQMFVIEDN
jgi:hypothetical protein